MARGKKVCKCGQEVGVRTKLCPFCSYDFEKGKQNIPKEELETVGTWVYDIEKGMPKICRPEPLPKGLISIDTIKEQFEYYGFSDCIWYFIPAKRIKDKKLQKLWIEARNTMKKVHEHVYK